MIAGSIPARRAPAYVLALAWALAAVVSLAAPGAAVPRLDQENVAQPYGSVRCATPIRSLYQSFIPHLTPLVAVALEAELVPDAGDTARIRLRAGSPDGEILAEAKVFATADGWLHFDFPSPLALLPGATYLLEWMRPFGWVYSGDDPYGRGEAYDCLGNLRPAWDFNFRTYASERAIAGVSWSEIKASYAAPPPPP